MRTLALCALALLTFPALAQQTPPLPKPRPAVESGPVVPLPRIRPAPKPAAVAEPKPESAPETKPAVEEPSAPPRLYQTACPAMLMGLVEAEALPPKEEAACGTQSPLSVTGVLANGRMVPFSGAATLDCPMATQLPGWVAQVDNYLRSRENTGIESVIVGTSYMCRNVNNASSGNLSFHAFADALDVTGFKLEDGRMVTVEEDWSDALSAEGRLLRFAHGAACTGFTTVLGPEANALHHDHFHIDLGCHGKTCTARICE